MHHALTPDALDNIEAAIRWCDSASVRTKLEKDLYAAFDFLAAHAGVGHRREDLMQRPVLLWSVGQHAVIFRVRAGTVEILRVLGWKRDTLFQGSSQLPFHVRISPNFGLMGE